VKLGRRRPSKQEAGKPEAKAEKTARSPSASRKKVKEKKSKNKTRQDQFVFSRRAILYWGVSFAVVAVWIFVLGVLVGRGLIFHSQTYKNIEKRIGEFRSSGPPAVTVAPEPDGEDASEPKLTFYKSLSTGRIQEDLTPLKKTQPASQPLESKKKTSPSPQSISDKKPIQEKEIKTVSKPTEKNDKSVVQPQSREASPTEPPARAEGENYTIQVAAVADLERAEKLVASLIKEGHPAYFYEALNKSQRYYRVRVGRYRTRREAETAMILLQKIGHKGMFISRLAE
jgi:cell division septation protein DedD